MWTSQERRMVQIPGWTPIKMKVQCHFVPSQFDLSPCNDGARSVFQNLLYRSELVDIRLMSGFFMPKNF